MKDHGKRALMGAVGMVVLLFGTASALAQQRTGIIATGSSTVAPFTRAVAQAHQQAGAAPVELRVVGTGGGFAEFCQGAGLRYPDIQNASRRMNRAEFTHCASRGVHEILEIPIGHDGLAFAHRRDLPSPDFRLEELWRGLAREVPQGGRLVPNPHTTWSQVSSRLPAWPIRVIGPPSTSGTRDSLVELVLLAGCQAVPEVRALTDAAQRRRVCSTLRDDGGWIEGTEDDEAMVRQVAEDRDGMLGVVGFSFVESNRQRIDAASIEGVEESRATIAAGRYPLSRPLFIYVKRANLELVPGLRSFVAEYVSDRAMGPEGYLVRRGLVPFDTARLRQVQQDLRGDALVLRRPES